MWLLIIIRRILRGCWCSNEKGQRACGSNNLWEPDCRGPWWHKDGIEDDVRVSIYGQPAFAWSFITLLKNLSETRACRKSPLCAVIVFCFIVGRETLFFPSFLLRRILFGLIYMRSSSSQKNDTTDMAKGKNSANTSHLLPSASPIHPPVHSGLEGHCLPPG